MTKVITKTILQIKPRPDTKRGDEEMSDEAIELLKSIDKHLEELTQKEDTPRLIYAKELSEKYPINRGTAIQFCKKYGIKFGGYCIEADKLKEILQTQGITILKE